MGKLGRIDEKTKKEQGSKAQKMAEDVAFMPSRSVVAQDSFFFSRFNKKRFNRKKMNLEIP